MPFIICIQEYTFVFCRWRVLSFTSKSKAKTLLIISVSGKNFIVKTVGALLLVIPIIITTTIAITIISVREE